MSIIQIAQCEGKTRANDEAGDVSAVSQHSDFEAFGNIAEARATGIQTRAAEEVAGEMEADHAPA
jgi:hypothetical protein